MNKKYKILIYSTIIILISFCFLMRETLSLNIANILTKYHIDSMSIPIYKYILNKNENNHNARINLSDIYFENGQGEKALELLDVDKELAGNFYSLYLNGCAYLTSNNMIDEAVALLSSAPGFYARTKISHKRPPIPVLIPNPGVYDKKIAISSIPNADIKSVYIKVNDGEYSMLGEAISLPFGQHNIYSVSVDVDGIISEEVNSEYIITKPVLAVQKDMFFSGNAIYTTENDTLT